MAVAQLEFWIAREQHVGGFKIDHVFGMNNDYFAETKDNILWDYVSGYIAELVGAQATCRLPSVFLRVWSRSIIFAIYLATISYQLTLGGKLVCSPLATSCFDTLAFAWYFRISARSFVSWAGIMSRAVSWFLFLMLAIQTIGLWSLVW